MDSSLTSPLAITIIVAVAVAAGFYLSRVAGSRARVTGMVRRSFWCPFVERRVTAEVQEHMQTGKAVDVAWCTAFTPAATVRCGKPCLRAPGFMRPLVRRRFSPPRAR